MYHEKSIHVILFVRALKDETTHIYGTPKETHQVFMILSTQIHPTVPTAKSTAGCLIVWKNAVQFAQKLYIQSSLIGALARGPCSSRLPAKV